MFCSLLPEEAVLNEYGQRIRKINTFQTFTADQCFVIKEIEEILHIAEHSSYLDVSSCIDVSSFFKIIYLSIHYFRDKQENNSRVLLLLQILKRWSTFYFSALRNRRLIIDENVFSEVHQEMNRLGSLMVSQMAVVVPCTTVLDESAGLLECSCFQCEAFVMGLLLYKHVTGWFYNERKVLQYICSDLLKSVLSLLEYGCHVDKSTISSVNSSSMCHLAFQKLISALEDFLLCCLFTEKFVAEASTTKMDGVLATSVVEKVLQVLFAYCFADEGCAISWMPSLVRSWNLKSVVLLRVFRVFVEASQNVFDWVCQVDQPEGKKRKLSKMTEKSTALEQKRIFRVLHFTVLILVRFKQLFKVHDSVTSQMFLRLLTFKTSLISQLELTMRSFYLSSFEIYDKYFFYLQKEFESCLANVQTLNACGFDCSNDDSLVLDLVLDFIVYPDTRQVSVRSAKDVFSLKSLEIRCLTSLFLIDRRWVLDNLQPILAIPFEDGFFPLLSAAGAKGLAVSVLFDQCDLVASGLVSSEYSYLVEYFHSVLLCYHSVLDIFGQLRDFLNVLSCLINISKQADGLVNGSISLLLYNNVVVYKVFSEIQLFSSAQWDLILGIVLNPNNHHQSSRIDSLSNGSSSTLNPMESFLLSCLFKVMVEKADRSSQAVPISLASVVNELAHKLLEDSFIPVRLCNMVACHAWLRLFLECIRYSQFKFIDMVGDSRSDSDLSVILTVHTLSIVEAVDRLLVSCTLTRSLSVEFFVCELIKRSLEVKLALLQMSLNLRSKNLASSGIDVASLTSIESAVDISISRSLSLIYPLQSAIVEDRYLLLGVFSIMMQYVFVWSDPFFDEKFFLSASSDCKQQNLSDFLSCGFEMFVLNCDESEMPPTSVESDINSLREMVVGIKFSMFPSFSLFLVRLIMKKLSTYNSCDHLEAVKCSRFVFLVLDIFPVGFFLAFDFDIQVKLVGQMTSLVLSLLPVRSSVTVNKDSNILMIINFISTVLEFHCNIHNCVGSFFSICDVSSNRYLTFADSLCLIERLLNGAVSSNCNNFLPFESLSSHHDHPSQKLLNFFTVIESFLPRLLFDCFLSSVHQSSGAMRLEEFSQMLLQIALYFVTWYSNSDVNNDARCKLTADRFVWCLLQTFHLLFEKILLFLQCRNFFGQLLMVSRLFNVIWNLLQTLQPLVSEVSVLFDLRCYMVGFYGKFSQVASALFAFFCRQRCVSKCRRHILRSLQLRMRLKFLKILEYSISLSDSFVLLLQSHSDFSYMHCFGVFTLAGTCAFGRRLLNMCFPRFGLRLPSVLCDCLFSEGLKDLIRKKGTLDANVDGFIYFSRSVSQYLSLLLVGNGVRSNDRFFRILEKEVFWSFNESISWTEASGSGLFRFGLVYNVLHCYYSQVDISDQATLSVLRRILFTVGDEILSAVQSCAVLNGSCIQTKLMIYLSSALSDLLNSLSTAVSHEESLSQRLLSSELTSLSTSSLVILAHLSDVLVDCACGEDVLFAPAFRSAVYLFHCVAALGSRSVIRNYNLRFSLILQVLLQLLRLGFRIPSPQFNMDYLLNRLLLLLSNTDSIRKHMFVLMSAVMTEFSCHHGSVFRRFTSGLLTVYVKLSEKDKNRIYQLVSNSGKEILTELATIYLQSQISFDRHR
jgi:hypothetical protein